MRISTQGDVTAEIFGGIECISRLKEAGYDAIDWSFFEMSSGRGKFLQPDWSDYAKALRAEGDRPALADLYQTLVCRRRRAEELAEHREGFGVADKPHFRIPLRKAQDAAGVVRLHVRDNEVVRTAPVQLVRELGEPFVRRAGVHTVHDGDLFV